MVRRLKAKRIDLNKYVQKKLFFWSILLTIAILITLAFSTVGFSQEKKYDMMPIDEQFVLPADPDATSAIRKVKNHQRSQKNLVRKICSGEIDLAANQTAFDDYLVKYFLASMTHYDKNQLSELGTKRDDLFDDYITRSTGAARTRLINNIVWPFCEKVIAGNYHAAARMNAIMIVGRLNDQEGASSQPPVPSSRAFDYLLNVIKDDTSPSFLKVGALNGLTRHAEIYGLGNQGNLNAKMEDLATQMIAMAKAPVAGTELKPEAQWLRRRSIQVLAALKARGSGNAIEKALRDAISDNSLPQWARYEALDGFRNIFPLDADISAKDSSKVITQFAIDYLKSEAKYIEEIVEEYVSAKSIYLDGGVGKADRALKDKNKSDGGRGISGSGGSQSFDQDAVGEQSGGGGAGRLNNDRGKNKKQQVDYDLPAYHINAINERITIILDMCQLSIGGRETSRGVRVYGMAQRISDAAQKEEIKKLAEVIEQIKAELTEIKADEDLGQFDITGGKEKKSVTFNLRKGLLDSVKKLENQIAEKKDAAAAAAEAFK